MDYYQVIEVSKSRKSVVIRKISGNTVMDTKYGDRGSIVATADSFIGPPLTKRVGVGDFVTINSYISLSKWDGTPDYWSKYA